MTLPYASSPDTPGCIYKPGDAIAVPRVFKPKGYFFVMVFGPLVGTGNLFGIPSDLEAFLKESGTDTADYWTNTAGGNELSDTDKVAGYYTITRMNCEVRLSQVEQCYIYWDYAPMTILDRHEV